MEQDLAWPSPADRPFAGSGPPRGQEGARLPVPGGVAIVRAMPNTAIAVRESMTCLASDAADGVALDVARSIFDAVGRTHHRGREHDRGNGVVRLRNRVLPARDPRGLAGLNRMEHDGFSSAMTRWITTSAERAARLYRVDE